MTDSGSPAVDVTTLLTWVGQPEWALSEQFLATHPALLDERAEAELYRQAAVQPRAIQVLMLDDHAWLLRLCREFGVAAGYAEYHRIITASRERAPRAETGETRHTLTGAPGALDAALAIRREIDAMVAGTCRSRIRAAKLDLGRLLLRRYLSTGAESELDEAVAVLEEAAAVPGAVPRTRAAVTELLARALRMRAERRNSLPDLNRVLAVLQEAVDAVPEDSSTLPGLMAESGQGLRLRYRATGDRADLDRAIDLFERADAWAGEVLARRPARLGDLGAGLAERYQLSNAVEDLDGAVVAFEGALTGTPPASPDRVAHAVNLAGILLLRHEGVGRAEDLDRAWRLLAEAEDRVGPTSPLRPTVHGAMATCLRTRYARTGDTAFLDQGIEHAEAAVATAPDGTSPVSELMQLGNLLVARAQRAAELPAGPRPSAVEDLDEAVASYERAVAGTPPGAPGRAERRAGLGIGLAERYLRTGAVGDLDRSLEELRAAVRATPSRALNAPGHLFNLGNVLWIRYGRTRRLDDLEDALGALQRAAEATPEASTDRPACLNSLAVGYAERHGRTGSAADLAECVRLLREASTLPSGADHTVIVTNLGNALRMLARATRAPELRDEAIQVLESALSDASSAGMPRAAACHNLASALVVTVGAPPDDEALDEAVTLLEQAVDLTPTDAADAPRHRAGLGRALRLRHLRGGDGDDYRRGVALLGEAAAAALATDLELAIETARLCANWALGQRDQPAAEGAFRTALAGLDRVVREQAFRIHKVAWLRSAGELHRAAAATFRQGPGDGAAAAEALERGRGLLLAEALDLRTTELDRLAGSRDDLAGRYRTAAERVALLQTQSLSRPVLRAPVHPDGAL